jgi:antitoxin ParD1/3/4
MLARNNYCDLLREFDNQFPGRMTTVTISLPDFFREFVETPVQTKGYGNISEYFRGLLRDAQSREEEHRLEKLLLEALDDPTPAIPGSPEYWEALKNRALERAKQR